MALTTDELTLLKKYIRIDHDDEDDLLEKFYERAKIYIKNEVGPIDETNEDMKEQYDQACALLVEHWNDNREAYRIGNNAYEIPYSLASIVRQLKYCYPVEDDEE
ncbi:head-tail connector protein [Alkalibacillus almallahensis]|uniref:head-tail connector protein n=1 Tax=Alkalibacillus almallahensis TaxID=1379154 RepID=UPI0014216CFA|nr:head-tail connector protein [Alkalibacillus almallahensis]NIK10921.1 putative phage protein (predicted DNA packaging) [Alkalibacillus almallahensis]